MNTLSEAFITGFMSQCVDHNIPEAAACSLLKVAQEEEMTTDPDWRRGFDQVFEKAAGPTEGMFSAPVKPVGDFGVGAAGGAALGGLLGLGALLKPSIGFKAVPGLARKALTLSMNPAGHKMFNSGAVRGMTLKPMTRATNRAIASGQLAADTPPLMRQKKENLLKYMFRRTMGPGNKRLLGGAAAGGLVGGTANAISGTFPGTGFGLNIPGKDNWLPSYMDKVPGGSQSSSGGPQGTDGAQGSYQGPNSVWSQPGGFSTDLGPGGRSQGAGSRGPTYSNTRINNQEVQGLDKEISDLQNQMSSGGGISGAVTNRGLDDRMRQLQMRKNKILQGVAHETGGLRRDQARAGQGIADKLKQVERAIRAREVNAQGAATWLEGSNDPGLGGVLRRGWNKMTGYENGAGQLDAEMRQLYNMREQLRREQSQVSNII